MQYVRHAEGYYLDDDGNQTQQVDRIKVALRRPVDLFGSEPATAFGPRALKVVMDAWVKEGLSRKYINSQADIVKRVFAWAVGEELLPPMYFDRLRVVGGLKVNRTAAPDHPPIQPAGEGDMGKATGHMPPAVRAMTIVQIHSGARAGELVRLRPKDIDTTADVWSYTLPQHKGRWKGRVRTVWMGKACHKALRSFLAKVEGPEAYIFSPRREEEERNAQRSEDRRTPKYASHMRRNAAKRPKRRKRPPGERFTTQSYWRAMYRACEAAGVKPIGTHQLRHLAATIVRAEFGIDHARAMLGHSLASMTEVYSRAVDQKLAMETARKLG